MVKVQTYVHSFVCIAHLQLFDKHERFVLAKLFQNTPACHNAKNENRIWSITFSFKNIFATKMGGCLNGLQWRKKKLCPLGHAREYQVGLTAKTCSNDSFLCQFIILATAYDNRRILFFHTHNTWVFPPLFLENPKHVFMYRCC